MPIVVDYISSRYFSSGFFNLSSNMLNGIGLFFCLICNVVFHITDKTGEIVRLTLGIMPQTRPVR